MLPDKNAQQSPYVYERIVSQAISVIPSEEKTHQSHRVPLPNEGWRH